MKGVAVAGIAFLVLAVLSAALLRRYRGQRHFRPLLLAFALAVAAYAALHAALPADLGVLPARWLEPSTSLDFLNGLLVLALLFHSFWDAVYTSALTGLSANVIVLMRREGGLSGAQVCRWYGAGEPLDRILAWRLPRLVAGGYVEPVGDGFRLRPKGRLVGQVTRALKRALTGREEGG